MLLFDVGELVGEGLWVGDGYGCWINVVDVGVGWDGVIVCDVWFC